MEIKKYENEKHEIIEALSSPVVKNANVNDIKIAIAKAMAKAIADAGQKAKDDDVEYLMKVVPAEIVSQVPGIRVDEIQIGINRGVYGYYGEYFGLNAVSFVKFLKKYIESKERTDAVKEYHKALEPVRHEPTEQEVQEAVKQAITAAYYSFLEKGFYEDYGNFIYDKMDERGMISLTSARKHEIYHQAQQSILARKNPENAGNREEFKEFTSISDTVSDPANDTGKAMIRKEAKKIALQVVFKDFKEMEVDITELVNQEEAF